MIKNEKKKRKEKENENYKMLAGEAWSKGPKEEKATANFGRFQERACLDR